jgi:hypothetical protein
MQAYEFSRLFKSLKLVLFKDFLFLKYEKGNTMSVLLRSLLVVSVTSLLMVGCAKKEEAPVEAAPVPVTNPAVVPAAPVAPAAEATTGGGGYEPTAEERVPGITLDAAAVDAATAAATTTEVAPAAPAAAPATK